MALAGSAVRVYVLYAVGTVAWVALSLLIGTTIEGPLAFFVGLLVLVCLTLAGLFLYGRR
ncbi:hypothetical protein BRC99_01660 [Halobacteriales archaeon QS_7_69_60]|nr:MAG: hypothetical protein BRC99_01660 [Halobacteriales archaeon QS_7_69_60]